MVMHARKLPRIDDGYADKREAQSYQSSQNPSKTGYSRHRSPSSRDSPSSRNNPRYSNKSSYIERAKEKYERGNESSPDKKAIHNYAGGSSNHSGNHSNSGNHSSSNTDRNRTASNAKDKNEVQKSAIRMFGDWSEHLSSTGKKYYYNIKTELSQWEKPREWNDSMATRPDRHSSDSRSSNDKHNSKDAKNRHCSGGIEKREKHLGDLKHMVVDGNPKPDKMYLFEKLQQSQSKLQAEMRSKQLLGSEHKDSRNEDRDNFTSDFPNTNQSSRHRRDSDGARHMARQTSRNDCDDIDSPGSTPTGHLSAGQALCNNPNLSAGNLSLSNLPNLLNELSGASQNNSELTSKALQTLQKLQQALTRQIAAHQTSVSNQSSTHSGPVQTSPHHHLPSHSSSHHDNEQQHPGSVLHAHPGLHHAAGASVMTAAVAGSSHTGHTIHYHHHASPHVPGHSTAAGAHIGAQLSAAALSGHSGLSSLNSSLNTPSSSIAHSSSHRSPYINNSHSHSHNTLQPAHSSPQNLVTIVTTTASPMTTGSTTIPITHTGNHVHRGNTVYGKFLGAQQAGGSAGSYGHHMEELGGVGDNRVLEGGGGNSERSSCGSPTPSETSSQGAPVDPDMFTGANIGHKDTNLMSTLGQYYKEQSVSHVTGWQGEMVEKQARLYHDESLRIGSLISSQVSVELKRARSLVRVEEIQATLHEQRNLFLAQQIAELENMKPVSSVSSFLPSTSTATSTS